MIAPVADNRASSLLLAEGFGLKAYSEDYQEGGEYIFPKTTPMMASEGEGLSSFTLDIVRGSDINDVSITASAAESSVSNVRDNDYGSYWEGVGTSDTWLAFEFCKSVELDAIHIAFKRGDLRVANFEIEASLDGESWTTLISNGKSSGATRNLETFSFPALNTKHIRIQGKGNSDNSQNHYTEVKFSILGLAPEEGLIKAEDYSSISNMEVCMVDDCAGYLGLTNATSDAEASYLLDGFPEGNYSLKLRMKVQKKGEISIELNDVLQDRKVFDSDDMSDTWKDIEFSLDMPAGSKELKLKCEGMDAPEAMQLNWLQLNEGLSGTELKLQSSKLYPNPCTDVLTIESDEMIIEIQFIDQSGRLVKEERVGGKHSNIGLSELQEGFYVARIQTTQGLQHAKFFKGN
jgi:hypothetical protein